jgi:hypothetical protein
MTTPQRFPGWLKGRALKPGTCHGVLPTAGVKALLDEVERDPIGLFWG